jgi:hypothetical protein
LSRAALTIGDMNILLDCAWCNDEVVFTVDETDDELVCGACNTRMDFAPDPATTFGLLYQAPKAA